MGDFLNGKQKAIAAFVVALLSSAGTSILTALQAIGDNATLGDLSQGAWITVGLAVLASTGLVTGTVYGVTNKPAGDSGDAVDGPGV